MKKKFLSLMMAAAVVATTSVSAFAQDYNVIDSEEIEHNVTITGDVANDEDHVKPGTIQVTVPTTTSFQVNKNGEFTAPYIVVNNTGSQKIDVLAYKFTDTNGSSGINIKKKSEVVTADRANVERNNVSLSLKGNAGTAYFVSDTSQAVAKTGVYSDETLASEEANGHKISSVLPNTEDRLVLEGEAGKKTTGISQPIQDTFTLTLKIKKSTTN